MERNYKTFNLTEEEAKEIASHLQKQDHLREVHTVLGGPVDEDRGGYSVYAEVEYEDLLGRIKIHEKKPTMK